MAGNQGKAEVVLSAVDQTKQAIDGAKKNLTSLGEVASALSGKFGSLGAAVIAAFGGVTFKAGVDVLDKLDDMAEKSGVAVEKLSALRYAGEATGTSTEALAAGIGKLSKIMAEAAGGNQQAAEFFKTLDVNVKNANGTLRSADEVLIDLAQRFASFEDGPAKAALAMQAFGKSGMDMIPLLNQGKAGLQSMSAEAKALGVVYSGDLAKQAADFNDNLTKIKLASEGAAIALSGPLVKALGQTSQAFIDAKKSGEGYFGMIARGAASMPKIPDGVAAMIPGLRFAQIWQQAGAQLQAPKTTADIQAYVNKMGANGGAGRGLVNQKTAAPVVPTAATAVAKDNSAANYLAGLQKQLADLTGNASMADEVTRHLTINSDKFTSAQKEEAMSIAKSVDALKLKAKVLDIENKALEEQSKLMDAEESDYADLAKQIRDYAAEKQFEADMVGKTTDQQERARFERELSIQVIKIEQQIMQAQNDGLISEAEARKRLAAVTRSQGEAVQAFNKVQQESIDKTYNATRGVSDAIKEYTDNARKAGDAARDVTGRVLGSIEDELVNMRTSGSFNARGLVDTIINEFYRLRVIRPLMASIFGGSGGGGLLQQLFGWNSSPMTGGTGFGDANAIGVLDGMRASGGPVNSGGMYLVGEKGPELFKPSSSGAIIPNSSLTAGGNFSSNPVINISGGMNRAEVYDTVRRALQENNQMWNDHLKQQGVLA